MKPLLTVHSVLLSDSKFLLLKRSSNCKRRKGEVDLPGGKVDPGEDLLEAGVREIFEETGVVCSKKDVRVAYTETYREASGQIVMRLICTTSVASKEVSLSDEHDAYEWRSISDISTVFSDTTWGKGVKFMVDHELLSR
jgi:8-oxo-dGTP diphosphatase